MNAAAKIIVDNVRREVVGALADPTPARCRQLAHLCSAESLSVRLPALLENADPRADELTRHGHRQDAIEAIFRAAINRVLAWAKLQLLSRVYKPKRFGRHTHLAALANAAPQSAVARLMFDLDDLTKRFDAQIESALREAFDESGRAMMDEIDPAAEFVTPQGVARKFVIERQNKLKNVPQEIYDQVKNELEQGSAEGETEPQLGARVKKVMGDIEDGRALTIARTETATAYNAGRMAALRQIGFTHKQWLTAHDDRVRLTHNNAEADGAIPIDEPFSNGLMYPGDETGPASEVINCRCVLQGADAP